MSESVFNTVELLEAILVLLPPKDIFKSQAVCRQFHDVVTSSTQIKRKLFYLTSNYEESWDLCGDRPVTWPLEYSGAAIQLISHDEKNTNVITASLTPTTLCPLLETGPCVSDERSRVLRRLRHNENVDLAKLTVRDLYRTQGSWRGMHLTDPPCKSAVIDWANVTVTGLPNMRDVRVKDVRVQVSSGVTLGDVVDALYTTPETKLYDRQNTSGHVRNESIDELRERFKAERGESDDLEIISLYLKLEGMVVPSDEEWAKMKQNGVLRE